MFYRIQQAVRRLPDSMVHTGDTRLEGLGREAAQAGVDRRIRAKQPFGQGGVHRTGHFFRVVTETVKVGFRAAQKTARIHQCRYDVRMPRERPKLHGGIPMYRVSGSELVIERIGICDITC